ncbi:hypothetical protein HO639_06980 [Streptococcus suis]|uniref:Uncharacterized protein n=1 Tax=Streptococcus suis TaxID=1307 RepID=A0A0Z8DJR7_STRSU|nr:hypothetical protein [Streptococcus suis]NQH68635.1 hypothetical protein [Streptococcus suis]NQH73729.1 hypothetical protein [Streptococcus suis]NQR29903.1 hypothetical protein [Streptococcus suis]NQR38305.1 hypothetical protein [Streptococcus suis]CYU35661.1 Uncharacterised protein [Streptococcus suis]
MSKKLEAAEAKYKKEEHSRDELKKKVDELQERLQQADYKVALAYSELLMALQVESGLKDFEELKQVIMKARPYSQSDGGQDV